MRSPYGAIGALGIAVLLLFAAPHPGSSHSSRTLVPPGTVPKTASGPNGFVPCHDVQRRNPSSGEVSPNQADERVQAAVPIIRTDYGRSRVATPTELHLSLADATVGHGEGHSEHTGRGLTSLLQFGDNIRAWLAEKASTLFGIFQGTASVSFASTPTTIIKLMQRNQGNATLLVEACRALLNVSGRAHADKKAEIAAKAEIVAQGGIESVLAAMKAHTIDAEVQRHALETLAWIAADVTDNAARIANGGGINLTIVAMSTHIEVAEVQWAACSCLKVVAAEAAIAERVIVAGGIGRITDALALHETHAATQNVGSEALWQLEAAPLSSMAQGSQDVVRALSAGADTLSSMPEAVGLHGLGVVRQFAARTLLALVEGESTRPRMGLAAIENMARLMAAGASDARLQMVGWLVLASTARGEKLTQQVLCMVPERDSLPGTATLTRLFGAAQEHTAEAGVMAAFVAAVKALALDPACRAQLQAAGAPEHLMRAMDAHAADPALQEGCCAALLSLACDAGASSYLDLLASKGVIERILAAIDLHPGSLSVQTVAFAALARLATGGDGEREGAGGADSPSEGGGGKEKIVAEIVSKGGAHVVVRAMGRHSGSGPVQMYGCQVLWSILARGDHLGQPRLLVIEQITSVAPALLGEAGLQLWACRALAALIRTGDEEIEQADGAATRLVTALISSMASYPDEAEIQYHACATLEVLSRSQRCREAVVPALPQVVAAMSAHLHDHHLQFLGCEIARHLAADTHGATRLAAAGVIPAIVAAMETHAGSEDVQVCALLALCRLTEEQGRGRVARIAQVQGVEAVVGAIDTHVGSAAVASAGLKVLWHILREWPASRRLGLLPQQALPLRRAPMQMEVVVGSRSDSAESSPAALPSQVRGQARRGTGDPEADRVPICTEAIAYSIRYAMIIHRESAVVHRYGVEALGAMAEFAPGTAAGVVSELLASFHKHPGSQELAAAALWRIAAGGHKGML